MATVDTTDQGGMVDSISDFEDGSRTDLASRRPGSEATLDRLRAMILSGELPPGSVVSQTRLAKSLGISTTPLREVIRQLQVEGLLEVELNRRPRVAPLDINDLHGVYASRILFESLGVAMTIPLMTDDDVAALRCDLSEMRRLAAEEHLEEWAVVHNRFHRRLVGDAPAAVAATLNNFSDRTERYRHLSLVAGRARSWAEADCEHERLVEHAAAGEAELASVELANHLARTALALSASFAPEVEPRAIRLAVGMVSRGMVPAAPPRRTRRSPRVLT